MKPAPTSADYPFKWAPDGTPIDRPPYEPFKSQPPAKKAFWLVLIEWGVLIVSALAIAFLIKTFLFQAFYIPSESMVPTLQKNDRVLVNKLSYKVHDVHRGDIVVFKAPKDVDPSFKDLVKRVIGLPGETIEGRKGVVYIDGKPLKEPYLPKGTFSDFEGLKPFKIPLGTYWVMGDNRTNSRDSRFFASHVIKKSDIVGRVFIRIWPLSRIDLL